MTPQEKIKYVDVGLRLLNIDITWLGIYNWDMMNA